MVRGYQARKKHRQDILERVRDLKHRQMLERQKASLNNRRRMKAAALFIEK
jgi:biotin synthase-related radical SAM superfamily protein